MDFFHIYNRGVDKRKTFLQVSDYVRFTQNLRIYNNVESFPHNDWTIKARLAAPTEQRLVTIHAYCLMPNHYHLLLSPEVDNGIALFMKKVNMGYSKYFNERYERSGALWQGRYKSVTMLQDAQFLYIPYYIHLNALDRVLPKWRKGTVSDIEKAHTLLAAYRWSSHNTFLSPESATTSPIVESFYLKDFSTTHYTKEIVKIITTPVIAAGSRSIEWR
jgi:putative transposase